MQWQRRRWVLQPQAQGRPGHQKLRRQKGPSARAPGLSRHPDLRLPPPELGGDKRALSGADLRAWTFVITSPASRTFYVSCPLMVDRRGDRCPQRGSRAGGRGRVESGSCLSLPGS